MKLIRQWDSERNVLKVSMLLQNCLFSNSATSSCFFPKPFCGEACIFMARLFWEPVTEPVISTLPLSVQGLEAKTPSDLTVSSWHSLAVKLTANGIWLCKLTGHNKVLTRGSPSVPVCRSIHTVHKLMENVCQTLAWANYQVCDGPCVHWYIPLLQNNPCSPIKPLILLHIHCDNSITLLPQSFSRSKARQTLALCLTCPPSSTVKEQTRRRRRRWALSCPLLRQEQLWICDLNLTSCGVNIILKCMGITPLLHGQLYLLNLKD